ncbi:MAG: hypothetical protein ACI8RZ_006363, partial [Myxococcota bacterium]
EGDVTEIQAAIQSGIDRILDFHPQPVHDAYAAALTYGGPSCPNETLTIDDGTTTTHWQEVCTYPNQYAMFNGPMTTWTWENGYMGRQTLPAYDTLFNVFKQMESLRWTGTGLNGQTDITTELGVDFNCSCLAISGQAQDDDGTQYSFIAMDGPSHWTGPEAEGTWLEEGIQIQLSGFAWVLSTGERYVVLKGYISGLNDDYGTIEFALPFQSDATQCIGWQQPGLDGATISIRQSETGYWTNLSLTKTIPNTCTVCTDDDTFCLDLTSLFDWKTLPW